jgi:hypothetical protein
MSNTIGRENMLNRSIMIGNRYKLREIIQDEAPVDGKYPVDAKLRCINSFGEKLAFFVPVSFVAKDWGVTPRRIRVLLREGRLQGRLLTNGYWEVRYPYLYLFGTRGPALKRFQKPERGTE